MQPIDIIGGPRIPFFILVFIGGWAFFKQKILLQNKGIQSLKWVFFLLWLPGVFSLWHTYSIEKTGLFIAIFPLLFLASIPIYFLLVKEKNQRLLGAIISITAFFWLFDAYVQLFLGVDLFGVSIALDGRVIGPFEGNWRLGTLLVIMIPVVLQWLKKYGLMAQFIYLTLLMGILFYTGVRTNLLIYACAVALYFMWSKKECLCMLAGLIPAAILLGWLATSSSAITHKKMDTFNHVDSLSYQSINHLLTGRLAIWSAGLNMFKEHPLTGVGVKAFNHAYNDYKRDDDTMTAVNGHGGAYHAHHPWVSIIAETGLIGFLALVSVVVLMFYWAKNSQSGINFQKNPWFLVFILILFPLNSMLPMYVIWWFPIVLLAMTAHIAHCAEKIETT